MRGLMYSRRFFPPPTQTDVQGYDHIHTGDNNPSHPAVSDWSRPGVRGHTASVPRLLPQLLY